MSALSDLQAASQAITASVATLQSSVTNASAGITKVIALLQALQNGTVNADDPQVAAVAAELTAAQQGMATAQAEVDKDVSDLAAAAP